MSTSHPTSAPTHPAVDRFLAAVESGALPDDLYTPDATLDATVPGWRFRTEGAAAIVEEYGRWFTGPCQLHVVERHALPDGEVVRYLQRYGEAAGGIRTHHVHLLTVEDDRIARDVVFCGGRWDPEVVAKMGSAAHAG